MKQQKEVEEMSALQKSMEGVQVSKLAIHDEMVKHMEFVKELNEKVKFIYLK